MSFIYLYSESEHEKSDICTGVIEKYDCITSTQAINELCNVFTKKWKLPAEKIQEAIHEIKAVCKIRIVDMPVIERALLLHQKYNYSYYDCLMLSSALLNDCRYFLSEDMQDGQCIETMEIVNIVKG